MTDLDILHSTYKQFYTRLKTSQDYTSADFIRCFLEEFVEAILQEWCGNLFSTIIELGKVHNSDHDILFSVTAMHSKRRQKGSVSYAQIKTKIGVLNNGDLVTFDTKTVKEGQTFTGDEYIDSYKTTYTVKEVMYSSEIWDDFAKQKDISSENMESLAVEIASEIIDIYDNNDFCT